MIRTRCWLGLVFSLCVTTVSLADGPGLLKSEFVYETAPFPSCHASTIVETTNGKLVSAFFAGTDERDPDVGIWVCRLVDGKWTLPVEVANGVQADGKRHPCWNPVLFQPRPAGDAARSKLPLLLFYKVGPSPSTWWGMLRTSDDDGQTWSEARRLPDGIWGPIKNKPVQLASGDILCPTSSEHDGWRVHFERTSDLGKTWTRTEPLNDGKKIGAIQPSVLFLGGDKLLALGRTQQKKIYRIASNDAGKTWGELTLTSLPNPNSGTDAVTLKDGTHLLVYNHTPRGRTPLNMAVSRDGAEWGAALVLESEPGEYSYPAVIQTSDGLVHVTYTWKRQRVRHAVIDPAKLQMKPIVDGAWPKDLSAADLLKESMRIVFLGDSITAAGVYVACFDAWLAAKNDGTSHHVIDAGLPSETVSGLSEEGHAGGKFPRPDLAERLERVLGLTKPDLVIACYGINCGIYEPFDAGRFERYQRGIRSLKQAVEKRGARFVVVTPPLYDDKRGPKPFSYNEVLDRYSDWLLERRTDGWNVVDLHGPMTREVARRRATDPDFTFQPDGVHPNEAGQWFVARQLIRWFGDERSAAAETPGEMLKSLGAPAELLPTVVQRVNLLRDSYVGAAGHKRPGIAPGLPVSEAEKKAEELSAQIRALLQK
ncbi:MAG: exo-alpha-sialidase [Planctomycetia bacterium]|nr:exo-alpha-sialidase [Planctomycetia bacterium]